MKLCPFLRFIITIGEKSIQQYSNKIMQKEEMSGIYFFNSPSPPDNDKFSVFSFQYNLRAPMNVIKIR